MELTLQLVFRAEGQTAHILYSRMFKKLEKLDFVFTITKYSVVVPSTGIQNGEMEEHLELMEQFQKMSKNLGPQRNLKTITIRYLSMSYEEGKSLTSTRLKSLFMSQN